MKPSDTRLLSHKRCGNLQVLPQLLQTLSQLYESSRNAEIYGMYSLLAIVNGESGSYLLQKFSVPNDLLCQSFE